MLQKYYDLSEKTIQVVHPTVSEEFVNPPPPLFDWRERLNTPKDAKWFYLSATNYEHKGLDLSYGCDKEVLKQKEFTFGLVGEEIFQNMKLRQKEWELLISFDFTGMIKENLSHLYRSADLFVLPSKFDTFGIVVIEALASGLPVLVSRLTGANSLQINLKSKRLFTIGAYDNLSSLMNQKIELDKEFWHGASLNIFTRFYG